MKGELKASLQLQKLKGPATLYAGYNDEGQPCPTPSMDGAVNTQKVYEPQKVTHSAGQLSRGVLSADAGRGAWPSGRTSLSLPETSLAWTILSP